ncbi:MAG: AAA family ATPase [Novipirellula sp. JB048]
MSVSINALKSHISQAYPDVEQVDDSVLRFTKRNAGIPFAVCFVEASKQLPDTREDVAAHAERVVGQTYFDQPKSVQWNHYLYFVVENVHTEAVRQAKSLIEQDTSYARKFVVDKDDFEKVLRPTILTPTSTTDRVDAISTWIEALHHSHLIEAVFGDYTRADRLSVADGTTPFSKSPKHALLSAAKATPQLQPLRSFKVTEFRPCLQGKRFDFRDVNLFVGVNGSGKTSSLEAIELYYCGKRTKRNRDINERYLFDVEELGKKVVTITDSRPESTFRHRNRDWYGVRELRRTKIGDSFGRFNFLNTDAAVDLGNADERSVNEDLARLLVGSDAAIIWPVIIQLADDVSAELRRASESNAQTQVALDSIQKQLAETRTIKTESDSLRAALTVELKRNQWSIDDEYLEEEAGALITSLSALLGAAQQAVDLSWIAAPVTLDGCRQFIMSVEAALQTNRAAVDRLELLAARQTELTASSSRLERADSLASELQRLIDLRVEQRDSELAEQRQIVTLATDLLAGIDDETVATVTEMPMDRTVGASNSEAQDLRRSADEKLKEAKEKAARFASIRKRSVAIAQQLRQLAKQIITEETADECPLCHTKFERGELERHMAIGLDAHEEAAAQKLLSDVTRLEDQCRRAESMANAMSKIVRYCSAAGLSSDISLTFALTTITEEQSALAVADERANDLSSQIDSLQVQGLSLQRLSVVRKELSALGFGDMYRSPDDAASLRRTIQDDLRVASQEMTSAAQAVTRLRTEIEAALRPWILDATNPRDAMAKLEERRVTTQQVLSRLGQFTSSFQWDDSRPIGEWIVEGERIRDIAAKLQKAMGTERVAAKTLTNLTHREKELQARVKQLDDRIIWLREADDALQGVKSEHSLEALTRSALQDNHKVIQKIFSQIHSPPEFESIEFNEGRWQLKRDGQDPMVKLTQISTGQRAAFALSVFLAQNAQLTAGPPVILIDDPIAHIDDLNCLSFLDYLREVALTGKRQIFFATASDKLASLFERKFDFLGDRFKRFDLKRTLSY